MLKLVSGGQDAAPVSQVLKYVEAEDHHGLLLDNYFASHRVRNHSPRTIAAQRRFLTGWFASHGEEGRPLYIWEAMAPVVGRQRILGYIQALIDSELAPATVRVYLGMLDQFFRYVMEHPYVKVGTDFRRLQDIYGPIEKPLSEFDRPTHAYDDEQRGLPLDPQAIYGFFAALRTHYLTAKKPRRAAIQARNYTLALLAAESGLRSDELTHLEISKDLLWESHRLQTRFAKATRGSGKERAKPFSPRSRGTRSASTCASIGRTLWAAGKATFSFCRPRGKFSPIARSTARSAG